MWAWIWWSIGAHAGTCDPAERARELQEASPIRVAAAFVALVECDEAAGREMASEALARMLGGEDSNQAVLAAVKVGRADAVRGWLNRLEPDQRSGTVDWLGAQCKAHPPVERFFVEAQQAIAEDFWKERWYRGLADCRTAAIQTLLTEALADPAHGRASRDRARFFGLLEVYARNLRGAAVPTLTDLVRNPPNPAEVKVFVGAFADAANVGSAEGADLAAATSAGAALSELGPSLPVDAVEPARDALLALGAPDAAARLVRYRWPERFSDGTYRYAVAARELVTCKNGKQEGLFHFGELRDSGEHWPPALADGVRALAIDQWGLAAAEKCKGTGEIQVEITPEPLAGDPDAWIDDRRAAFRKATAGYSKVEETAHPPLVAAPRG